MASDEGEEEFPAGEISFTMTVPAEVPSVFHSSWPATPLLATK